MLTTDEMDVNATQPPRDSYFTVRLLTSNLCRYKRPVGVYQESRSALIGVRIELIFVRSGQIYSRSLLLVELVSFVASPAAS